MTGLRVAVRVAGVAVLAAAATAGILWRAIDTILPTSPFDIFEDCADDWDDYIHNRDRRCTYQEHMDAVYSAVRCPGCQTGDGVRESCS